jgi:hypothetical protein
MAMNAVYVADELFDRVASHLTGTPNLFIHRNGALTRVEQESGLWIQFGPQLHCRISNEDELRLACAMVTAYHDSLRSESELLDIQDAAEDLLDTQLLEEAAAKHLEECADELGEEDGNLLS